MRWLVPPSIPLFSNVSVSWLAQDDDDIMEIQQDICDMLKLFPDAPICKLAILCNADCRDVSSLPLLFLSYDTEHVFAGVLS